jgi:hypothetical protein
MHRRHVLTLSAVGCLSLLLAVAASGNQGTTFCSGSTSGTFGDVVVPAGEFCGMRDAVVNGDIRVDRDAQLFFEFSTIHGDVDLDHASFVLLGITTLIDGSVRARDTQTLLVFGDRATRDTTVTGDIRTKKSGCLSVDGVQVLGDIVADKTVSCVAISNDTLGGSLLVEEAGNETITAFVTACGLNVRTGTVEISKVTGAILVTNTPIPDTCGTNELRTVEVADNFIVSDDLGFASNLWVEANSIADRLEVSKNQGFGNKTVQNNVSPTIICEKNAGPFDGGPNSALTIRGQCF